LVVAVAYDTIETQQSRGGDVLSGSTIYFTLAAGYRALSSN
jgi:hypothetical protein